MSCHSTLTQTSAPDSVSKIQLACGTATVGPSQSRLISLSLAGGGISCSSISTATYRSQSRRAALGPNAIPGQMQVCARWLRPLTHVRPLVPRK